MFSDNQAVVCFQSPPSTQHHDQSSSFDQQLESGRFARTDPSQPTQPCFGLVSRAGELRTDQQRPQAGTGQQQRPQAGSTEQQRPQAGGPSADPHVANDGGPFRPFWVAGGGRRHAADDALRSKSDGIAHVALQSRRPLAGGQHRRRKAEQHRRSSLTAGTNSYHAGKGKLDERIDDNLRHRLLV